MTETARPQPLGAHELPRDMATPVDARADAVPPARSRSRSALRVRARSRLPSRSRCGRPALEAELAIGFLKTEGLIDGPEVTRRVRRPGGVAARRRDDRPSARPFDASRVAERHFVATASCGICGKASLDEIAVRAIRSAGAGRGAGVILALPDLLRAAQRAFEETGGLHATGLFKPTGELVALREDVGRHNALDKLVGSQVLAGGCRCRAGSWSREGQLRDRPEGGGRRSPDPLRGLRAERPRDRGRRPPRGDARRVPARRRVQRLRPR